MVCVWCVCVCVCVCEAPSKVHHVEHSSPIDRVPIQTEEATLKLGSHSKLSLLSSPFSPLDFFLTHIHAHTRPHTRIHAHIHTHTHTHSLSLIHTIAWQSASSFDRVLSSFCTLSADVSIGRISETIQVVTSDSTF